MDEQDISYYRQRAARERAMAIEASRSDVAAIHLELANQFEASVCRAELRNPPEPVTGDVARRLIWDQRSRQVALIAG